MNRVEASLLLFGLGLLAADCVSVTFYYKSKTPEDFLVGALFPVHRPPYTRQNISRACGETWERPGIQRLEAALHTVDEINARTDLLPNSKLGIQVRDSCWFSPIALEQASHFIQQSAWTDVEYREQPYPYERQTTEGCEEEEVAKNLVAVIGPLAAAGAAEVNSLLSLFRIPEIGYSFTGQEMGLRGRMNFYVSVVPMDQAQARAMIDLVRHFNWTYVSVVYTEGDGSSQASVDEFTQRSVGRNICVSQWLGVPASGTRQDYLAAVENLRKTGRARVVVCFCNSVTVQGLFTAMRTANATGEFTVVASDAWTTDAQLISGLEAEALGSLALRVHVLPDMDFEQYYTTLNPVNNTRNPWFREFWQTWFNCSLCTAGSCENPTRPKCTGNETLREKHSQDPMVSGVKSALYMVAYALDDMLRDYCATDANVTDDCTRKVHVSGERFVEYLRNVSKLHQGTEANKLGDGAYAFARYDIVNFQALGDGLYEFMEVATWSDADRITIYEEPRWKSQDRSTPLSECGRPCSRGQIRVPEANTNLCCWKCVPCGGNQYVLSEYRCENCQEGTWPNHNLDGCDAIPQKYLQWTEKGVILVMVISALALATAACVSAVYIRYINTPLIKASSRELSFVILVGTILSEASTFAVLAKPSPASCFAERLFPALSVAAVHSAIFTKTNRVARILAVSEYRIFKRKLRFMSTTAQLVTTGVLILGQVIITGTMLIVQRPGTIQFYPAPNRVVLLCDTSELASFLPLAYDFFLIALCTVYAVKTRNVPENFNEAKMIGFAMYSTVVIWVAYIAVYIGSENNRELALCLAISISSFVVLVLLFLPRVYIVLFQPKRNRRSSFLTFRQDTKEIKVSTVAAGVAEQNGTARAPQDVDS